MKKSIILIGLIIGMMISTQAQKQTQEDYCLQIADSFSRVIRTQLMEEIQKNVLSEFASMEKKTRIHVWAQYFSLCGIEKFTQNLRVICIIAKYAAIYNIDNIPINVRGDSF